jgi:3-oxoacyl-[acyl-carrier-protein] synthase-3
MSFKILGTGSCLPEFVLNNETLTKMVDTTDEWITLRTGISERRILTKESIKDLSVNAAKSALKKSNIKPEEIDLIICATVHGQYLVPALSCIIQAEIGAKCPAFDINAACSGFIYGLNVAKAFLDSGTANKVLLVAAESMSQVSDYTDRATCVLFGDGAGAVVLEKGDSLLSIFVTAKGDEDLLTISNTKGNSPFIDHSNDKLPYLEMKGPEVYKFAVQAINRDVLKVLDDAKLSIDDIDYFVIHQANARIVDAASQKLKIPEGKLLKNIHKYGNTSAACIPIMLDESINEGKLKKGMKVLLTAFGGGLTTGAAIIKID